MGPCKDKPAYNLVIQGMGGLMGITGDADGPPIRIGVAITDIGAEMYAAIAVFAALNARDRTGQGQWIEVSILDTAVSRRGR